MTKRIEVSVDEAGARLLQLAERALQGDTVVILKDGKPFMDLVPHAGTFHTRKPGSLKGKIWISADFDKPDEGHFDGFEGCL